ncbi:MAG: hypothetical protein ACXWQO_11250 [Bdellovibrionota bacterium]
MKYLFPALAALFLLASCGPRNVPAIKKKTSNDVVTCPSQILMPEELVTVFFNGPLPGRMAIDVGGQRKYSECAVLREAPPIVKVERLPGNRVALKLQRFEQNRAADITFAVKNLKDCKGTEEDVVKADHLPLRYAMEYPNGEKCSGHAVAHMEVIQ